MYNAIYNHTEFYNTILLLAPKGPAATIYNTIYSNTSIYNTIYSHTMYNHTDFSHTK